MKYLPVDQITLPYTYGPDAHIEVYSTCLVCNGTGDDPQENITAQYGCMRCRGTGKWGHRHDLRAVAIDLYEAVERAKGHQK